MAATRYWALGLPIVVASILGGGERPGEAPERSARWRAPPGNGTCVECHTGIEDIHPGFPLSCAECHGGDDTHSRIERAHVQPRLAVPTDERVLPLNYDLPYRRFVNPSDLRVARAACGTCHETAVDNMLKSLHATTSGHLGDGYYEHGLTDSKTPVYSIFPIRDHDGEIGEHAIRSTRQVPPFRSSGPRDRIETHYSDLPRKACMQCHLYGEGRALDGRLGMDGDYRGAGCAACHVTYSDDGRSRSGDPTIDKLEPGHPRQHRFTTQIPTSTCTRCHYGDASIGLHFRGMAQLVPGMPAGPEVEGTTDSLLNGVFYIQDPDMTPPDVHHQRGMHCIDCHTVSDVMGDGDIYPQMDFAVEIECTSCHGTFERVSDLTTSHGRRIPNLEREGELFFLTSKVTGERHPVVQAAHVVDPQRPEFNPRALEAMTSEHGRLECYTCHSGWNVDFFGFHFDRNEQFTQLDLISGKRTPGRVTTQEKVFATFNQLRLGFNHEGMISTYMVGFSTIGSARDENGEHILHQATPETAAGLSGVTMIPHQPHTTRPEARSCVECHRSPVTWGLGSTNFRLIRPFGYAVTEAALHTVAIDSKTPARTAAVAQLDIEGSPQAIGVRLDPVHARATHAFVGGADGTLTVVDLRNPVMPRIVTRKKLLADPRRMLVQGDYLYVADGTGGLSILDVEKPGSPKLLGTMPSVEARSLALSWPWLCVADGAGGLVIVDVSDPSQPKFLAEVDLNAENGAPNEAFDVALLFQYSRTEAIGRLGDRLRRSPARHLAFVACGLDGVRIVDITEPTRPQVLHGRQAQRVFRLNRGDVRGIAVNTMFDIGSAGGGLKSQERDYLYVYVEQGADQNRQQRIHVFDVSDPMAPERARGTPRVYGGTGRLLMFRAYNEPFLQHFVAAVGAGGLGTLVDVSKMQVGAQVATTWSNVQGIRDMVFEEFAFDRMVDERGRAEKDISHEGSRYLSREEILRVLRAKVPVQRYATDRYGNVLGRQTRSGGRVR